VVHIGPMKTGTTALAISLIESTNSGRLANDFVYPIGDLWWDEGNPVAKHHSITSLAMVGVRDPERQRAVTQRRAIVSERLDNLAAVLRARGDGRHSVMMIAEGAPNRVDPVVLTESLRGWFDEVVYCLVVRGQVPGIESSLSHAVRKSVPAPANPSERAVNVASVRSRRFDYARIVARWGHLENARLVVVPFLESDIASYALFDRLFSAVGLPLLPREEAVDGKRLHSAISSADVRRLRRLAALHRALAWQPSWSARVLPRFARAQAEALHRSATADSADRRPRLSARKAEQVRRDYVQSNAELQAFLADASLEPGWVEWFAAQRPVSQPAVAT
jgi:hypothetical protein